MKAKRRVAPPHLLLTSLILAALGSAAYSKNECAQGGNEKGGECLAYLGRVRVETSSGATIKERSIWLSSNIFDNTNDFLLEPAQSSVWSDQFNLAPRGFHISFSPLVATGGGGTHKLYILAGSPDCDKNSNCNIDTDNQQGGFDKVITVPGGGGGGTIDPVPPIGVIPPDGGGGGGTTDPVPPIGVLPPDGGGGGGTIDPVPPIGVLPPDGGGSGGGSGGSGGGVGGGGGNGSGGSAGGSGGGSAGGTGVAKTIDGVFDTLQGHGIAITLKRAYGISDRVVNGFAARHYLNAETAGILSPSATGGGASADAQAGSLGTTPSRDLGPRTAWSAWIDTSYLDIRDERYGLTTDGSAGGIILGVDREVRDSLVVGLAMGYDDVDLSGYADTVDQSYDGYYAGPYLGYRINDRLVFDAWVAYGEYDADSRISVLDGGYDFTRWFGSFNLTGQYQYREFRFRPKLAVFYAHDEADDYEFAIRGVPGLDGYELSLDGSDDSYGLVDGSIEVNRLWTLSNDLLIQPYGRFGIRYDFERPNDGELITPDLRRVTPSASSGNVRLGVKALIQDRVIVDASAGYLSLGQDDLDVWGGRLAVSWLL